MWTLLGLLTFLVCATATDLASRRIPNYLTACGFCLGLLLHLGEGAALRGWSGMVDGILGSATAIAIGLPIALMLWRIGAFGGGDVKLILALGAFVEGLAILELLAYSLLLFSLAACAVFVRQGRLGAALKSSLRPFARPDRGAPPDQEKEPSPVQLVPYAPAALLGCCISLVA